MDLSIEKQLCKVHNSIFLTNHSSGVGPDDNIVRSGKRMDLNEKVFVHFSLVNAEKVCNLVELVNS